MIFIMALSSRVFSVGRMIQGGALNPQSGEIQLTVHNNDRVDNTPGDSESQVLLLDLPLNE